MAVTYQTHGKGIIQAIVSLVTIGVSVGFVFNDYDKKGTLFIIGMCFLSFNLGLWYNVEKIHKTVPDKRQKYKKYLSDTKDHRMSEKQRKLNKIGLKSKQAETRAKNKLTKQQEKSKRKFAEFKKKMCLVGEDTVVEMEEQTSDLEDEFEFKTLELKLGQKINEDVLIEEEGEVVDLKNNLIGNVDSKVSETKDSTLNKVDNNVNKVDKEQKKVETGLAKITGGISDILQ